MDYSAKTAFKQNRRLVFQLMDEIDDLISIRLPEPTFRDVGDIVEARNHLEKARAHLKTLGDEPRDNKKAGKTSRR